MTPLLRAELLKLRTTRTFAALVGIALALSLLVVTLSTTLDDNFSERDVRELFTLDFSGLFILLLGVIGMAGEWRHRTITGTVLAAPDRVRLLAAKTLSYALAGALLSLLVTVTIMGVGTAVLSARGETTIDVAQLADVLWRNLVIAAFLGSLGVCIGGLVRNPVVAIVGLLIFSFALEPAVLGLAPKVGRFGPTFGLSNSLLEVEFSGDEDERVAPGVAVLGMVGWVAVAFGATAVVLRRRDLT